MRLAGHPALDALCGEYLLGTLRGAARRRFEASLRAEPRVAQRLEYWQSVFAPRYTDLIEVRPSVLVWRRLERTLGLARYRAPWFRRYGFWRGWAVVATAVVVAMVGVQLAQREPEVVEIAQLASKDGGTAVVTAHLSRDRRTLVLHASRPVVAGPAQSYELWLLPAGGGTISLAVLGSLDARFVIPQDRAEGLRGGAKLAISVEPAGGSPKPAPTGPVILVGAIRM